MKNDKGFKEVAIRKSKHALDSHNHVGIELEMSNTLVRAADRLNLTSKRLIWSCMAKANLKKNRPLPGVGLTVKITAEEYMESFGGTPDNAYRDLKKCALDLRDELIEFRVPDKRGTGFKLVHMRWVGRTTYYEREGWVEVAFWHEVVPHLVCLENEFTRIKLQQASALRSTYSWDLLRLLSQFKSTGLLNIPIEEFHHAMNVPESCKKDFGNLRKRCIEPAVKELTDKDGLDIDWKPTKAGRKVTGLVFKFSPSSQGRLEV